jgi:hypothetical protein
MRKIIINFLQKLEKSGNTSFILKLTILSMLVKVPGAIIGDFLVNLVGISSQQYLSVEQMARTDISSFITAVIIAPPIETFFGQFLPLLIMSRIVKSDKARIIISALIFSLSHLPVLGFLPAAFFAGLIFSWGYVVKSKNQKGVFWIISCTHCLQNFLSYLLVLIFHL